MTGEVQEKGEQEVEEVEEELLAPPGDWWGRIYLYDEFVQMIYELSREFRTEMKGVARKGGKRGSRKS